jgi:hypothetical protein
MQCGGSKMKVEDVREGESMTLSESDKLNERLDEWNAIYPFFEWLKGRGIWLAHIITKREYYGEDYEDEPMDTMVPITQNLESLLYEYFDVDPAKLERERKEILESLWVGGA